MKNIKLKFGFYLAITVFLTFGLSLSLQSLLAAWQAPSDLPPLSNINPPIFDVSTNTTFHVTSKPLGVTGNLTVNGNQFVTGNQFTTGNVGIGTTSPTAKLEVSSGTRTTRFSGNSILFSRSDGPAYIYANSEGGYLAFGTNGRSTSVINSNLVLNTDQSSYFNGNVGIGNASPSHKLDVNGNARVSGKIISDPTLVSDNQNIVTTKSYVDAAYSQCSWRTATTCNLGELMRGYSASQLYCCSRVAPTCTPTSWTTISSVCVPDDQARCDLGVSTNGHLHVYQSRVMSDCQVQYQTITSQTCEPFCLNIVGP